jgi:taurine transport system permease protein
MTVLGLYAALFLGAWLAVRLFRRGGQRAGLAAQKTVTFGDESAVRADRAASVISLLSVFLIWGAFTGSKLVPVHVPGPFVGDTNGLSF